MFIKVYYTLHVTVTFIDKLKYWLTRKTTHCFLLVGTLLRQPQIVEPFDNFHLQMIRHSPHPHVRLHAVQLRCNQETIVFVTIYDFEWQLDRNLSVYATSNETSILYELIAHVWYTIYRFRFHLIIIKAPKTSYLVISLFNAMWMW